MKIHRENLIIALQIAIKERETEQGYTSGLTSGWQDLLDAVVNGDEIEFFK